MNNTDDANIIKDLDIIYSIKRELRQTLISLGLMPFNYEYNYDYMDKEYDTWEEYEQAESDFYNSYYSAYNDYMNSTNNIFNYSNLINEINPQDLSVLNVDGVPYVYGFRGAGISSIVDNLRGGKRLIYAFPSYSSGAITNAQNWFYYCEFLKYVGYINMPNCYNTNNMFFACHSLNLASGIIAPQCRDMTNMFYNCYRLRYIGELNLGNSMYFCSNMFRNCSNLRCIPIMNTSKTINANNMFYYCSNITDITGLSYINMTDANYMFAGCGNITTVNSINLPNIVTVSSMFANCRNLVDVEPIILNTSISDINYMFRNCVNLTDDSICNIIDSFLNTNLTNISLNSSNAGSPFYGANISNTRYQNRWKRLNEKGYTY